MQHFNLTISEVQKKNLILCLDRELKSSGIENLPAIVDLYNIIQSAQPVPTKEAKEDVFKKDKEGTQEKLQSDG